jgi:hypothetical protein
MKVGHILKDEVKDMPVLQYPLKIIINEKSCYSQHQKIENHILLLQCKEFINNLQNSHNSTKSITRSQSLSKAGYRQRNFGKSGVSKQPIRKYSNSLQNNPLANNLPLIKDNSPIKRNISQSTKTIISFCKPKYRNSIDKEKINSNIKTENNSDNKLLEKDVDNNMTNNISSFTYLRNKRGVTPNLKTMKIKNKNNLFINDNMKKINHVKSKHQLRYERKYKFINNIINKLNKPLFINDNIVFYK